MNRVNLITALLIVAFFVALRVGFAWGQTQPTAPTPPPADWSSPIMGVDGGGRIWWIQTSGDMDSSLTGYPTPEGDKAQLWMWTDGQIIPRTPDAPTTQPADADSPMNAIEVIFKLVDPQGWDKIDDQLKQAELQAGSMKLLLEIALSRVKGTDAEAAVQAALDNAAATVNRLAALRNVAQAATRPSAVDSGQ